MDADFNLRHEGSVVGFTPITDAAQTWIDENVQSEGWQWMGPTLWIDHRFGEELILGIERAGLTVVMA